MEHAKDVLVDTDWVAEHLDDPSIRIVEVDENRSLYREGHIPGATGFDWQDDLQDRVRRSFLGPEASARCSGRGASPTATRSCSTAIATTGSRPTRTGT